MELGIEDALCGVSTTTGLYPSDDALLTSLGLAEPSGDSTSSQFVGLESTGSASHNYQKLCLLEANAGAQGTVPVMDACQMLDVTGLVDPCVSGPQCLSDVVDFTPIRIKEACEEGQAGEGGALLGGSPKSTIMEQEMIQGAGMGIPQVLYGVPMDSMVAMSEGHAVMSDALDHGGMMVPGMSTGMEVAYNASMGLLEPSLTNGKAMWTKSEPGHEAVGGSKTRWKPNSQQLCLLEQHFKSGYTKATPELYSAVQGAGPATEAQVSVWLKNRLARCKRQPKHAETKTSGSEGGSEAETGSPVSGIKRERDEDDQFEDYFKIQTSIFEELSAIMSSVDPNDVTSLARAIRDARVVCCYGVGREGLVMKGLASNLHHMGFEAYTVGDTNTPTLGKGDLFLVSAGPSYYSTVSALSLEAMRSGARVIAFTAHKTAPLPFAERVVRIASQTLPPCMPVMNRKLGGMSADVVSSLPDGKFSVMQMGASFEMSLALMMECACIMLQKKTKVHVSEMRARHTNLE
ncbi:unnamed protein product [Ostreobium quekettii]|uniref:Homeobox domain-containing protein n=1 Tax=Ostreobium quekettii TaxID=121088 RepID=A0A8S1IX15_9CHLO|nr:unnamed protein product [Ostreobium quekettii]